MPGENATLLDGDAPQAGAAGAAAGDKGAAGGADKGAAGASGFQQTPDEKAAADKAAADKTIADKAAADKVAADAKAAREAELAKMSPEDRAKAEAADKTAADAAAKAKQGGAPEKYEPFKMPEGVKLDDALTAELQTVAKELNLPQAAAQKVADLGAKLAVKFQTDLNAGIAKVRTDWAAMSQADKEFGGDKLQENLGVAKRGRDALASPDFRKFLNESGLGNHPEMIRVFYRAGQMLAEDKLVTGNKAAGSEKSMAERLYGASTK